MSAWTRNSGSDANGPADLTGWPAGSRVIVRRERAHPGAQLSFTDHDCHRFQAVLTDQPFRLGGTMTTTTSPISAKV